MRPLVVAFVSGMAYEALSVAWVHEATRGSAAMTPLASALQAIAQVAGIGESVRDRRAAPFFVFGYAVGAYAAMVCV